MERIGLMNVVNLIFHNRHAKVAEIGESDVRMSTACRYNTRLVISKTF